jgi:hypothetical protein
VVRELPFILTLEAETKLVPVIVRVNPVPPTFTGFGLREIMVGTGFERGGSGLPRLPDPPPPQLEKNNVRK